MTDWLQNNLLGTVLASVCGFLVLVGVVLTLAWNRPPSADMEAQESVTEAPAGIPRLALELGPFSEFEEVNQRPVFNESRRPIEGDADANALANQEPDLPVDAPEVRLTGVVITPDQRYVTLTPNKEGEAVIAQEGMPLEGEYAGWSVDKIEPRQVSLTSRDGQSFNVELMVHDQMIEEPPEPEPVATEAEGEAQGENTDRPLSRAEEIRQRIQERREQLRREAEEDEENEEADRAEATQSYQEAIRSMMNRNRNNDNDSKEDEGD